MFDRMQLPPAEDDGVVTAFRDGQVTLRENRRSEGFTFATKKIGYQGVRAGDLVVHSMDGFAGAIGVSESTGKCSPVYVICQPREGIDARFYAYVLRHMALSGYITSLAKGIRERSTAFGWGELKEQWLPVPSLPTQKAIAGYLDEKTAAIDALIEKKRKLLDLLAEERAALINQAVTKGLDPSVPMKDSGIPWIGEIPAHWDVPLLRLLARIESGHTPSRQHPEYWIPEECVIPWFSLADVWQLREGREKYLGDTNESISEIGMANSAARLLPKGTVVLSRTASVGFSGTTPRPMATTQDFVNWLCGQRLIPDYLLWLFRAMKPEFQRIMMGSTHQTIYMPDVRQFRGPLPPIAEQKEIAAFLDQGAARFGEAEDKINKQIDRLQEYRQALITAAVTGQLNIGDAA